MHLGGTTASNLAHFPVPNDKWMNIEFFYVSLTVHFSITLDNDQLDAQIFNTFITILYVYMFRAISYSSSGGQIVLTQHLVSSLSVSDRSEHRCTERSLTESDDTRCCVNPSNAELNPICYLLALLRAHHLLHVSRIRVNTIWSLEDDQDITRKMYR